MKEIKIRLNLEFRQKENLVEKKCFEFLNQAEIEFGLKDMILSIIQKECRIPILISKLQSMGIEEKLLLVLTEIITSKI